MKKGIFFFMGILALPLSAQVGINTPSPNPSASLDVVGKKPTETGTVNRGILPPRVDNLKNASDKTGFPSPGPATGLLVFNNSTTSGSLPKGMYYNNGTPALPNWVLMNASFLSDSSGSEVRKLQYYGTPDASRTLKHGPFEFRLNKIGTAAMIYQVRINPDYSLPNGETVIFLYTQKKAWGTIDNSGSKGIITFTSANRNTFVNPWDNLVLDNNGHNMYASIDIRNAPTIANQMVLEGALPTNQSPMFYNLLVQNTESSRLKSLISIRY